MGRIKTVLVKRIAKKLIREHAQEFSEEFNNDKGLIEKYTNVASKKMRNIIAGYAARLIKQKMLLEKEPRKRVHEEDLSKFYE